MHNTLDIPYMPIEAPAKNTSEKPIVTEVFAHDMSEIQAQMLAMHGFL